LILAASRNANVMIARSRMKRVYLESLYFMVRAFYRFSVLTWLVVWRICFAILYLTSSKSANHITLLTSFGYALLYQ
jgi:hypothetical protein